MNAVMDYRIGSVEESLEDRVKELKQIEDDRKYCTIVTALIGAILGWAIGVAQLMVIGSWDLVGWTFMPLIPLYSGLGWALFGMILGGSGIFSKTRKPAANVHTHYSQSAAA